MLQLSLFDVVRLPYTNEHSYPHLYPAILESEQVLHLQLLLLFHSMRLPQIDEHTYPDPVNACIKAGTMSTVPSPILPSACVANRRTP